MPGFGKSGTSRMSALRESMQGISIVALVHRFTGSSVIQFFGSLTKGLLTTRSRPRQNRGGSVVTTFCLAGLALRIARASQEPWLYRGCGIDARHRDWR